MNGLRVLFETILNAVAGLGFFSPFVFIPVYIIGTILFVPTAFLCFTTGVLFGVWMGFAVALISSLSAASLGFLAGRYWSRKWVLKNIASNKKLMAIDKAVAERGWKIVLFLRFSAVLPFTLLNYGLGLSQISFKHYFLASLIGMAPGTFLSVYLGSLAGKLVLEADKAPKTPLEWAFIIFGCLVTVGMGLYSASIVKKTLQSNPPEEIVCQTV